MIVLIWKLTSVPPLSERSQTFSGKPLLCSQTAGCTFSAKEKEEFKARIKYYVTTLGNMIIIMIHLDVVDYDPCQKCHIVLTNLKHTSNISPHFQNIFFFQKIWFDLISDYFIVPCTTLEFLLDLGLALSCIVTHITTQRLILLLNQTKTGVWAMVDKIIIFHGGYM